MIIDTSGNHAKISVEEIQYATEFFAKELMPRAYDKLYIDINLIHMKDMHGVVDRLSRYEYQIDISKKLGYKSVISTLAHEMVHVRQMFRGELTVKNSLDRWNGKTFPHNYDYYNCPWEIEAYGREVGLTHKYLCHVRSKHI
jgi:alpha-L-arabinofuranosidase